MKEYIEALGREAEDVVTGFSGVVESVMFDICGSVQVILTPPASNDPEKSKGRWFDFKRLKFVGVDRVLPLPTFAVNPDGF